MVTLISYFHVMCTNINYIYTRSKILSPYHRERLLVPCKCGKCSECQAQLKNEWYFRIYHEWIDCIESGSDNFVFFDTLTYSDEFLPHLSEFFDIPKGYQITGSNSKTIDIDFPCFCYEDVRFFMMRLRRNLEYQGYDIKDNLKFFLSSEYGTSDVYRDSRGFIRQATHRPHYHVLFFSRVPNLTVSHLRHVIDNSWYFGRTDRVRYYGVHSNVFRSNNHGDKNARGVSNYVAKYVQKCSCFQPEIDFRLTEILRYIYDNRFSYCDVVRSHDNFDCPIIDGKYASGHNRIVDKIEFRFDGDSFDSFLRSQTGIKLVQDMKRFVNQFHRQSSGFGLCALRDVDLIEVLNTGFLTMPDSKSIVKRVPIPLYYERHLFQELVTYNGVRVWQYTDFGKLYKRAKELRVFHYLIKKYTALSSEFHEFEDIDKRQLARYVVFYRHRFRGDSGAFVTFSEKCCLPNKIYNYSTPTDKALLHGAYVSRNFIGCSGEYFENSLDDAIPIKKFLHDHMIRDDDYECFKGFEKVLHRFEVLIHNRAVALDNKFKLKQNLDNVKQRSKQLSFSFA